MRNSALISCGLLVLLSACGGTDETETSGTPAACDTSVIGNICTIAGSGASGYDKDADEVDYVAVEASMYLPQDTLSAPDGSVYVLDWNNHRIRKIGTDGMLSWVAGRGELGGSLDDPENGDFNHPTNIIFDKTGDNILISAWHNSKIRSLALDTYDIVDNCGDGKRAYFGDDGPALGSSLDLPASLAYDKDDNLVIMDQANQVLRWVDSAGDIHKLAGQCIVDAADPAGPGACAEGVDPVQCPPDAAGRPAGKWVCGDPALWCGKPCTPGYAGDDGPATEMRMAQPFGQAATPAGRIVVSPEGEIYFADTGNSLIRKIDKDGIVTRVAGQPPKAGVKQLGYAGDGGQAVDATLNLPVDLALDEDGSLYFTDVQNHCVRKIAPDGVITTAVGKCGTKGTTGDGGPAADALLKLPYGLEIANGKLLIADTGNQKIRSVKLR